jgi:hypothetical protein
VCPCVRVSVRPVRLSVRGEPPGASQLSPDAPQILPRCSQSLRTSRYRSPNASKTSPRCLPTASQMPPRNPAPPFLHESSSLISLAYFFKLVETKICLGSHGSSLYSLYSLRCVCESAVTSCTCCRPCQGVFCSFLAQGNFCQKRAKGHLAPCKTLDIALVPCLVWRVASHRPYLKSNRYGRDWPCMILESMPRARMQVIQGTWAHLRPNDINITKALAG